MPEQRQVYVSCVAGIVTPVLDSVLKVHGC